MNRTVLMEVLDVLFRCTCGRTKQNCVCQAQNAALEAQANTELAERIKNLEQEVARHREDSGKAQAEVDRLLEILREMENEKNDKDKKISELER